MRFWDSSAVVPLLLQEAASQSIRSVLAEDPHMVVWSLTSLEITSALWRRARAGDLEETTRAAAAERLATLEGAWNVLIDVAQVAERGRRLLALHPLRAADAAQLAGALVACRERTATLDFVTLDARLADAARREGLRVLP